MQNNTRSTKSTIEAGLITAIVVIIMLMNAYVPAFSAVGSFILPIPIMLLYLRHDLKVALMAVIASGILISMFNNPILGLSSAIVYGIVGLTFGHCVKNNKKVSTTIVFLAIASLAGTLINYVIYLNFIDKQSLFSFISEFIGLMKESITSATDMYAKMGISEEQIGNITKNFNAITPELILTVLPAILLVGAFALACITYVITRSILKKLKYDIKPMIPFNEIYINIRIGTFVAVFSLIGVILSNKGFYLGKYLFNSSMLLIQYIGLINGVTLVAYYLKRKLKFSKYTGIIIVLIMFSKLSVVCIYAGLADLIFDFRKLDPYRKRIDN